MHCPNCGLDNTSEAHFCLNCGARLALPAKTKCPMCGCDNKRGAVFCENCGVVIEVAPHPGFTTQYAPPSDAPVYSGFWLRYVAYIIDTAVLSVVAAPLYFLIIFLPLAAAVGAKEEEGIFLIFPCMCVFYFFAFVIDFLYFSLMESSKYQATVGKMALGIIVTDMEGNRLTFGRAAGRTLAKALSGLAFSVGFIIAGFTEKKQALHDIITNCLVVMKKEGSTN